jgi:hypothetical protein
MKMTMIDVYAVPLRWIYDRSKTRAVSECMPWSLTTNLNSVINDVPSEKCLSVTFRPEIKLTFASAP